MMGMTRCVCMAQRVMGALFAEHDVSFGLETEHTRSALKITMSHVTRVVPGFIDAGQIKGEGT